jgi:hypothetical protein
MDIKFSWLSWLPSCCWGSQPLRTVRRRGGSQQTAMAGHVQVLEARQLLTTIDLATLSTAQGTTIFGADSNDRSGFSVSSAGDFNGDGFDDLLIGAYGGYAANNAKSLAGESYVVFGGANLPSTIDLGNLGTAGVTLFGAEANDQSGFSVSVAGDVNGDGFDDLLIGVVFGDAANNAKSLAGESYVVFGGANLPSTIDLGNLGTAGVTLFGAEANDQSGFSVSMAGDVNGDGFDDLLIGAPLGGAANNAKSLAGESYVVFGGANLPSTIDLGNLGTAGITLFGADANDQIGRSVSRAGDVNGDGFDDLLIGAPLGGAANNAKTDAGESYVVFGGANLPSTIDLANLGAAGLVLFGADANDRSGWPVSGAGDVNGDGFDDLLIGAWFGDAANNAKTDAGESYVVFGGANLPSTIDLGNLGTAGITLFGAGSYDYSGISVSGAGDVNGDGFDDLLIGATSGDPANNARSNAGESYVIFGGANLPSTIDLGNLGNAGITLLGVDIDDQSGRSVRSAGDVNGDGFGDLLIGAWFGAAANNAKSLAGESYLIYGGNGFTNSVTQLGTAAAETLTGTTAANIMDGARANDTLVGNGGADVLTGGQGNDILAVSDLTFRRIVGGTGTDTLRLDGSGLTLDLTAIADNRIQGIEAIDITGSGDNTLTLTLREVLNLSDESNTLVVRRNRGDVVNLGSGWTQGANEVIGPDTFSVYSQGAAILKVQSINTPPAAQPSSVTTDENQAKTFAVGDFGFSDIDSDSLVSITISALNLAAGDSLTLNGNAVTVNQTITAANIANLVYTPAAEASGSARSTFGFRVNDVDLGTVAATMTINVTAVNDPPTVALQNTVTTLPENTSTVSRVKVADIVITDDALGTNNLSLTGADASSFEIFQGGLYVKAGVVLDFETKASYAVTVNVDDNTVGNNPDASVNYTLSLSDVNEPPTVALQSTVTTLPENTSTVSRVKVADIVVTDDAFGTNVLSLSGADAARFEIFQGGLYVRAGVTLNFEAKPTYNVVVNADDPALGSTPDASVAYTLTLTNVNEAPEAYSIITNMNEDGVLTGRVWGWDPEAQPLAYELVGSAANGSIVVNANGTFQYRPRANFFGSDQFTFRVSDGTQFSNTATTTINVANVNDLPIAYDIPVSLASDSTLSGRVWAWDPEGSNLTYELVGNVSHGTLTLLANGNFTYRPRLAYVGPDQFTFRVFDGIGYSNVATVTIAVGNRPPEAYSIPVSVRRNGILTGRVWGWDPEAQPLTYELVTDVNDGTLTFQANGSIVYRPRRNFVGTDTFTFRVSDGVSWSNTATVTITVTL